MLPADSTLEQTKEYMLKKLEGIVPEVEIYLKADLVYEINRLKKEKDALILGHNYMEPALFNTIPDVVGDSLHLSIVAAKATQSIIIFCGVRFMAETAKILNPDKTVLLPAKEAGCSLASSITAQDIRDLKAAYPGIPVVAYVNTYADVKAEVDYCCTSGNAARVVEAIDSDQIIFLPDEFLAKNIANDTGKSVILATPNDKPKLIEKDSMVVWNGRCEVHDKFTVEDVKNARSQFDDIEVVAHPECSPEVVAASDYSGSTTAMVDYVKKSKKNRFLILTECSMGDNIMAENPEKELVGLCSVRCQHMNQITLEDTLHALRANETLIELDPEIAKRARVSLERMISL